MKKSSVIAKINQNSDGSAGCTEGQQYLDVHIHGRGNDQIRADLELADLKFGPVACTATLHHTLMV